MTTVDHFKEWCKEYLIKLDNNHFQTERPFKIGEKSYLLIDSEVERLFTDEFKFLLPPETELLIQTTNPDYLIVQFGNLFYFSPYEEIYLKPFLYQGEAEVQLQVKNVPYLGIHGEYELCNGSRLYRDWCQKAKFLNVTSLGICENNTLAGIISFQQSCKKEGIKPILGETLVFSFGVEKFKLTLFAKNETGFETLIYFNNTLARDGVIDIFQLRKVKGNLFLILSNESNPNLLERIYLNSSEAPFYQIDLSEWDSDSKDKEVLLNTQNYLQKWKDTYEPVLLSNSYYLEKSHSILQKKINKVGSKGFVPTSQYHYFKSWDEIYLSLVSLSSESDSEKTDLLYFTSLLSAQKIYEECNFEVKLKNLFLPKYEPIESELVEYGGDNELLFLSLIQQGLEKLGLSDNPKYLERIKTEYEVIKEGGFIDYFLILWDLVRFCEKNNIWYGLGRGSAAGCMISYLLKITQIDPLRYDLLFERFLNRGRLKSGLPDIDFDVESSKRDDLKAYMQEKYGFQRVANIGTYQTFKVKGMVRDLGRVKGLEPEYLNIVSKKVDIGFDGRFSRAEFTDLVRNSVTELDNSVLRKFVVQNQEIIEAMNFLYDQSKNCSTHAAGLIIVPRYKNGVEVDIDSWVPIRVSDGQYVTEWEGSLLDDIGFLKNDLLGLYQLDKFHSIYDLIKETTGELIDFDSMDLDNKEVLDYFKKGLQEDVFQFGAAGLKAYCQELQPERIEDLIATVALYRPGPIFVGTHQKYIKLKDGKEEVSYHWGCEEITKETYGLIVYQEQAIRICQVVGGFSLVEADEVRKAMGKMLKDVMGTYKIKFVSGAVGKGCPEEEADYIWEEMSRFAEYSFNKSHAACYAITAYYSQWYKVKYPLQFWTVSLSMSKEKELPARINEINLHSKIKLLPPDINESTLNFQMSIEKNTIYWSLGSISYVTERVLDHIFEERERGGEFFSLSEFIARTEKRIVNKRVVTNLILSGCFDSVAVDGCLPISKDSFKHRLNLLNYLYVSQKHPLSEIREFVDAPDYFYSLKQKDISSFGFIDYSKIYSDYFSSEINQPYIDPFNFLETDTYLDKKVCLIGVVQEVIERSSKRGSFCKVVLDINSSIFDVTVWNETYESAPELSLPESIGKIVCITGVLQYDSWQKKNCVKTESFSKVIFI